MSKSIVGKIKINSFADIVGGEDPVVTEVPLKDLHTIKNHPFRVLDDEKMDETVKSIKENGVLVPGIVRPRPEGGYEIISGHRRKRACELAGLETMPVMIRDYTDDEAIIAMVDSNIQREDILPSEKAHAYRQKYDVVKHQGVSGGNSLDMIGAAAGDCGKTVQRFIALSYLTDRLLDYVDKKKIPVRSGVELSCLGDKEQKWLEEVLDDSPVVIPIGKAKKIKGYFLNGELSKGLIKEILTAEDTESTKVVLKPDRLMKYFPRDMLAEEIEERIYEILDEWKKGGN